MIRQFIILLSITYLMATANMLEVVKLPLLFSHGLAFEGSFVDFMEAHYGNMERGCDETSRLPFAGANLSLALIAALEAVPESRMPVLPAEGRSPVLYTTLQASCPGFTSARFIPPRLSLKTIG